MDREGISGRSAVRGGACGRCASGSRRTSTSSTNTGIMTGLAATTSFSAASAERPSRAFVRRILAPPRHRRRRLAFAVNVAAWLVAAAAVALAKPDDRFLLAPALALAAIVVLFFSVLWARDGIAPVFESGSLCVLATAMYAIFPLAGFYAMHGQWYMNAD